jgi:hypothetical protein
LWGQIIQLPEKRLLHLDGLGPALLHEISIRDGIRHRQGKPDWSKIACSAASFGSQHAGEAGLRVRQAFLVDVHQMDRPAGSSKNDRPGASNQTCPDNSNVRH